MLSLFSKLLVSALLIFSITLTCKASGFCGDVKSEDTHPETSEPISNEEFLSLIKNNQCVLHKRIQASAILSALKWAQQSARQNSPLPSKGIWVQYSKIEGLSQLSNIENSDFLITTPVSELPAEIANIYKEIGINSVIEIPVSLVFEDSIFTDKYFYPIRFENFLFKENVTIGESTFRNGGVVSFSKSVFYKQSNFNNTTFENLALFNNVLFQGAASFNGSTIQNGIEFLHSTFQQGVNLNYATLQGSVKFNQSEFNGTSSFNEANLQGQIYLTKAVLHGDLSFGNTSFKEDAFFTDLNGKDNGILKFYGTNFQGRTYFTNSRLHYLLFFPNEQVEGQSKDYQGLKESTSPVSFGKRAVFHGLQCDTADFSYTEFRDHADFSSARFSHYADFSNSSFTASVNFFETDFPLKKEDTSPATGGPITGLVIDNAEIQKPLNLKWEQIKDRINTETSATWRRLEELFKQEDDLNGQNESKYQEMYLEGSEKQGLSKLSNRFQLLFWGYGVRPWQLAGLILIIFSIFTGIYFTQTKSLAKERGADGEWWKRLKFAAKFSALNCIYLNYGYQRSRTTTFKVITLIQALGFKVLLFFLLKSFANVIPVVNELAAKLLPF